MAILALMVDDVAVSKFELTLGKTTLGRNVDNDILIDDLAVSGHHACIHVSQDPYWDQGYRYQLEDLDSTNTTLLNQHPVEHPEWLNHGDSIQIGYNFFKFLNEAAPDFEKTSVILPDHTEDMK